MSATTNKPLPIRAISRVKVALADMNYAQRRLLEIRTGIPFAKGHGATKREDDELEALFRMSSRP
jgi:hypothetical protein